MGRGKPLTVRRYLVVDGKDIPWEELTQEQIDNWQKAASERLSKHFSRYYAQHPEEYIALCKELDEKEAKEREAREKAALQSTAQAEE
nr:MAG TPA: hypothetical protein [Caudoviricetes sp.]DAG48460.1 MAG TPA: hypothetical protein [Caudoviricetes sp.]